MSEGEVLVIMVTGCVSLVVGIFGKILFDWLKNRNGNGSTWKGVDGKDLAKTVYSVSERVNQIMDIQCKTDGDGLPMVYMPRGYREIMDRVAESVTKFGWSVEQNTKAMKEFTEQMRRLASAIEKRNGR